MKNFGNELHKILKVIKLETTLPKNKQFVKSLCFDELHLSSKIKSYVQKLNFKTAISLSQVQKK